MARLVEISCFDRPRKTVLIPLACSRVLMVVVDTSGIPLYIRNPNNQNLNNRYDLMMLGGPYENNKLVYWKLASMGANPDNLQQVQIRLPLNPAQALSTCIEIPPDLVGKNDFVTTFKQVHDGIRKPLKAFPVYCPKNTQGEDQLPKTEIACYQDGQIPPMIKLTHVVADLTTPEARNEALRLLYPVYVQV